MKNFFKTALCFTLLALCFVMTNPLHGQKFLSHNFNNGQFFPFIVDTDQSSRVIVTSANQVRTQWKEANWDGTNYGSKAQFKPLEGQDTWQNQIWIGFRLKIANDYMSGNRNTEAGLMQIWGFNDANGSANWMAMLKFEGRNNGLVWVHRKDFGSQTIKLVKSNFPKNQFVNVVISVNPSSNGGRVRIWLDGTEEMDINNTSIGWGDMNSNGMTNKSYAVGASFGQYNYRSSAGTYSTYNSSNNGGTSNHYFLGHQNNETRTVYYDNVEISYDGGTYSTVNPSGASKNDLPTYRFRKRNNTSLAMDGNNGGSNYQNVYLYANSSSNVNQQWVELDRGGGFYSYQKNGTNLCIDGGNGGSNWGNVYLYECQHYNINQHWWKGSVGSYKRFIKRGTSVSMDSGGPNNNIHLWNNNSNNQNQQWLLNSVNLREVDDAGLEESLDEVSGIEIYPNPTSNVLNVDLPNSEFSEFVIYNVDGRAVLKDAFESPLESFQVNVSSLTKGLYVIKLKGVDSVTEFKFVKE